MINIQYEEHHSGLGEQIEQLLATAVPWVEKVTGLQLPQVKVILADLDQLACDYSAFVRRQIERDIRGRDLTRWEQAKVIGLTGAAESMAKGSMATKPFLIATSHGQPSTLIAPETLGRGRLSEAPALLCELLVAALAQQAQVFASGGKLVPPPQWPKHPGSMHPDTQLSEGHAQWTSKLATPEILSTVGATRPRRQQAPLAERIRDSILEPGARRRYARAASFVEQAVSIKGLAAFNRVWYTPELIPTRSDFRRPRRWTDRLTD